MKTLDAKLMNDKLKAGWTIDDFTDYFGCTAEEFESRVEKMFSSRGSKEMLRKLETNNKMKKKMERKENKQLQLIIGEKELQTTDFSSVPDLIEVMGKDVYDDNKDVDVSLEELNDRLCELNAELSDLELMDKRISQEHNRILKEIASEKEECEKLAEKIAEHAKKVLELSERLEENKNEKGNSSEAIKACVKKIEEVEEKIKNAKSVTIFVYNSGEIDVESEVETDCSDWQEILDDILKDDRMELLTVRQIKSLAKVISLVKSLGNQGIPWEVYFDNKDSEEYFLSAIA